jgi:eukaryotic-like serine/threonine-protein kinase
VRTLILPAGDAATLALSARALAGRAQVRADLEARRGADRGRRPEAVGPGRRPAAVAGVVLLVLALLGGGGYLWWDLVVAPVVAVPDVVGLDRAAAEAALRERGLRMEIDGEEHRVGDPAGRVVGQAGRGERVRTGAVVPVVLSLGPRVVAMPDLLGQPYDAVRDVLDANLFRVALERQHSDTVPAGAVMGQLPRPGEPVEQGAEVAVTVSRGVEQVAVPRLVGLTRDVAEAEAAAARLGPVEVVEEHSDEQPVPGVVLRQVPGPGEQVDVRSPVQLVVSQGPLTIPVPELTGLDVDEAVAALEAAGLEAVHRTAPQQTLGPFAVSSVGVVEGQVPDAGEDIRRDEPVEIYYFTPR